MCVFVYFQTYVLLIFFSHTLVIHLPLVSKTQNSDIYFQESPREASSLLVVRFSMPCAGGWGSVTPGAAALPPIPIVFVGGEEGFKALAGCAAALGWCCAMSLEGREHPWIWASLRVRKQTPRHIWSQASSGMAVESDSGGLCRGMVGCPVWDTDSAEAAGTLRTGHRP